MKQKIVIRVSGMTNKKSRNKVLKMIAGFRGVQSAALAGNDMTEIEVIGDEVDAVRLMTLVRKKLAKPFCWLRHKMSYVELLTVTPVEDEGQDGIEKPDPQLVYIPESSSIPQCVVYDPYPPSCSIL